MSTHAVRRGMSQYLGPEGVTIVLLGLFYYIFQYQYIISNSPQTMLFYSYFYHVPILLAKQLVLGYKGG